MHAVLSFNVPRSSLLFVFTSPQHHLNLLSPAFPFPSSSYGLPPDFVVKVLKYERGSIKRLRSALEQLYGHLDKAAGSKADVSGKKIRKARIPA